MSDLISRQDAIDALSKMMPKSYTPDGSHPADEGIFMAQEIYADCIETLELLPSPNCSEIPNNWIPVSERLPGKEEWEKAYIRWMHASEFIVMIKGGDRPSTLYLTHGGIWIDETHKEYDVVAWMPLPAPFQSKEEL